MSGQSVNLVFTDAARRALELELGPVIPSRLLQGDWRAIPHAGDLLQDKRLSRRMFVVVSRLFITDDSGATTIQLLLNMMATGHIAPELKAV